MQTIKGFMICDSDGDPIKIDGLPDDANNVPWAPRYLPIFIEHGDALDVLNSLPGTADFEGFGSGTVRSVILTVGDVVADQDPIEEDDGDDKE